MAQVASQYRGAFISLIQNIDDFDIADRKHIQYVVIELHSSSPNLIEQLLTSSSAKIIDGLLKKYADEELVTFIGVYLRMFTDSSGLVNGWLNVIRIKTLLWTVQNEDYNIQTDAVMTLEQLFLKRRLSNTPT